MPVARNVKHKGENVPDWAIKIFHQVVNTKKAWQLLIGIVFMLWIWPSAMELTKSRQMASELSGTFTVLFSLCAGFVIVEIISSIFKKFSISYGKFLKKAEAFQHKKRIVENIRLALPQLPRDQYILLLALKDHERKLDSKGGSVFWLENAGYIVRRVQLEHSVYMYGINPDVKVELEAFLRLNKEQ